MTSSPSIPYRLRSDLHWSAVQGRRRRWWIASDPLRSQLFRCSDEVRTLLRSLDGHRSLQELQIFLASNASQRSISEEAIRRTLQTAIQRQLLVRTSHVSAADPLPALSPLSRPPSPADGWLASIQRWPWFFIQGKQRLGNPAWLWRALADRSHWLFSASAVIFWSLFIAFSFGLVLSKVLSHATFRWPNLADFETHAVSIGLILLITRMIHEMGHAAACVRLGASCRELGVFFMLGVACPYVDVTDSWRLPHYRSRMAIAAAGVYVEWILAAIAGCLWYFTSSGWLHTLSWQVLLVCSVTTFLINANPLMRYDGYFLLSDYLEMANLREEADAALREWIRRIFVGPISSSRESQQQWRAAGLIFYACASWWYRVLLMVGLIGSVLAISERWFLPKLGLAFAGLASVSFLLNPLSRTMYQTWSMAKFASRGPYRVTMMWFGFAALIVVLGWIPLPNRVAGRGTLRPEKRSLVYTQVVGRIASRPPDGSVESGEASPAIQLENPWLADQVAVATYRHQRLEGETASLRHSAYQESSRIDRLPTMLTLCAIAEKQTEHARRELSALTLQPSLGGRWTPLPLPPVDSFDGAVLTDPSTVNDPANRGRWLPAGTPIGYIADQDRVVVEMNLPVSRLAEIQIGTLARVRLHQLPGRVFKGKVIELSDASATPDDVVRSETRDGTLSPYHLNENDSYFSVSLQVEEITTQDLAMEGTAEVVLRTPHKSLYQHTVHLVNAMFDPSESRKLGRSP